MPCDSGVVNGPPCGTCGTPQRWVLERNTWGCDRCRTLAPASQPPQQQGGSGPSQASLPGYAPAQKGAFAGGMQRTPSVAPGSYVAPSTLPPANNIPGGTLPGGGGGPSPYSPPMRAQGGSFGGTPTVMGNPGTNPFAAPYQPGSNPQAAPLPASQQPSAPNPYGQQPSVPNAVPNAYGQQPSAPYGQSQPNAYGQQQPYGQSQPNAYGQQPYGQSQPNAYGQPAAGQPPAYGQPQAAYGQPQAGQYGAQNAYGQPSAAPAQPYAAQPSAYAAAAAAPLEKKRSKKGLFIVAGLVVAVGAGVGIALAVSGGGGGKGGAASRDELVEQTIAAFNARDVDGAIGLMGANAMERVVECKEPPPAEDLEKAKEKLRELYKKQFDELEQAKAKLELVKVLKDSKNTVTKGTEQGSCTVTEDFSMVNVDARVKVTLGDGKPQEREWKLNFVELGDKWYLTTAMNLELGFDCEPAIQKAIKKAQVVFAKQQISTAAVARIEKKLIAHCSEDGWNAAVAKCLETSEVLDTTSCFKQLSSTQRENVEASIKAILDQEAKAKEPPPLDATNKPPVDVPKPPEDPLPPEEPGSGSGSGSAAQAVESPDPPPSCEEAKQQIAKLARCKGISKDIRDGYKKTYDLILEAWNTNRTPAVRTATDTSCATLVKSLLEFRKSVCR
jgi:hypothetical protein